MAYTTISIGVDPEENELKGSKAGEGSWTMGRSFSNMWQRSRGSLEGLEESTLLIVENLSF